MKENKAPVTTDDSPLFQVRASFVQHSLPGLEAGKYTITAQQQLDHADKTSATDGPLPVVEQVFGVEGEKYTISQASVHSRYPPNEVQGEFSTSLPQIIFQDATKLPWIRSPYYRDEPVIQTHTYDVDGKPQEYDDDKATWLFVMSLNTTDFEGVSPRGLVRTGTVADLIPDTMTVRSNTSSTPIPGRMPAKDMYSIFSYVFEDGKKTKKPAGSELDPGIGHDGTDAIKFIDIPIALFQTLAPSMQDLQLMAHVRSVKLDNKALADGKVIDAEGEYAVVMGNRLPQSLPAAQAVPPVPGKPAPGTNDVFVVSLEKMECALRGYAKPSYFSENIVDNANGHVRLVVLNQWSFTSYDDTSFEFKLILGSLNDRTVDPKHPSEGSQDNPHMRLPNPPHFTSPTEAQKVAEHMLSLGYVPMNHLTRKPDVSVEPKEPIQTVSWYRGPLAPFAVEPDHNGPLGGGAVGSDLSKMVYSADKLLRFDPTVGMYDTSYAAAWQLGRLLALQDKSFSVPYYQWQRSRAFAFRMSIENALVGDDFADLKAASQNLIQSQSKSGAPDNALFRSAVNFFVQMSVEGE
ncbi:hypothetical protein [uncultured Tateyamaria sp.]|uniref:hypothetical protein n=1 Tax=uncultured Tateyamaria sp. TaxID=455651 RepID=UPI0026226515|nr:hypothetical protein [uncultured Tateyamaria sp.]